MGESRTRLHEHDSLGGQQYGVHRIDMLRNQRKKGRPGSKFRRTPGKPAKRTGRR